MSAGTQYSRPPLVEALLDIQVDPGTLAVETLLKCQRNIKSEYPDRKDARYATAEFSFGRKVSSSASSESAGYIFTSPDKKQLFQTKLTGFTFNRLAPYLGWSSFLKEAERLWEEYRGVAHPRGYKRVALRYINRFDIPAETIQLETYFRTYPEVSRELPQLMAGFFFQFNLPIAEIRSTATITQTAVQSPAPGTTSVVLDIDLYRTEALPPGDELWALFETLRIWKNKIFEACITDRARELIR